MLPPLEPQPMQNQTSSDEDSRRSAVAADNNSNNGEDGKSSRKDMKKFECAICFEYMDEPVSCGQSTCETRFCQSCLRRVLRQEIDSRPPSPSTDHPSPNNSAKCPHCRSFFTLLSMITDWKLKKEIDECTDTITCPYQGCNKELPINQLKAHEATCPSIRMRCRFAPWGCTWIGKKSDLDHHNTHHCEFRQGLGKLVERVRQGDAKAGHVLQQHHMQIYATSQMLSLHSRQLMMMRGRNVGNVWDVLRLGYEVSLFPGRFSAMREVWSGMIHQQDARCVVCNVMLLVPSMALVLHVSFRGFKLLSSIQIETLSGDDVWFLADALLLSLIISMLGILCIACFFIDTKSPMSWTIYNIKHLTPAQPLLRDLAAICMAMIHFSAIEFIGLHPGILLWHFTAIVTVLYTAFVCRIIEKNTEPSSTSDGGIVGSARAWPIVIFGLRYGLLTGICGLAPTVNAMVLLRLFKQMDLVSSKVTAEDSECFLKQTGSIPLLVSSSLVTAYVYGADTDLDKEGAVWIAVLDWAFASAVLAYVNAFVFLLDKAGRKLGETNFNVGNRAFIQAHQASGATVPNIKPTTIGCSVFGVCSFLLLCVAMG